MRANAMIIAILLTLSMSAFAGPKQKFKSGLLRRCDDGIAVACYDYGVLLSRSKSERERRQGALFIRRACSLAYQPACQQKLSNIKTETVVTEKPRCDLTKTANSIHVQGNVVSYVEQDSVWYRAGAQPGDRIVSLNDREFTGYNDLTKTLGTGSLVMNVERNGKPTSLMVNCK